MTAIWAPVRATSAPRSPDCSGPGSPKPSPSSSASSGWSSHTPASRTSPSPASRRMFSRCQRPCPRAPARTTDRGVYPSTAPCPRGCVVRMVGPPCPRNSGWSALDGTRAEAGDQPLLYEGEDDDDRHRRDHTTGSEGAQVDAVGADEGVEADRDGLHVLRAE